MGSQADRDIPVCLRRAQATPSPTQGCPRMPVAGEVPVPRLAPSPRQPEEGMLPLLSCCLQPEGIHYLPGYRQLSKAIFQLCSFKELIGGEIILSRRRHNLIHLPEGLSALAGGPAAWGQPRPPPRHRAAHGETQPWRAPCRSGGPTGGTGRVPTTAPHWTWECPCCALAKASLHPIFPLRSRCSGSAQRLHEAWGQQSCPAQHRVPNSSPPALTRSRSCGDQAPRGMVEAAGPACALRPRGTALPSRPPA